MSDPKIKGYEDKMNKAIEFLEADLQTVRAGRANPHILDHVRVDYYGAPTPLQQVANVSVPEARIIQIQPWDKNLIKDICRAIQMADIGINPTSDATMVRLVFPEMTEENRKNLAKDVKFDNPKVVIPYGSILGSEPMSDKDGKVKTNQYGQILNSVTVSLPEGVKVGGYSLDGFTAKVVVVDKYLDGAADEGSLQIMFNSRADLKLTRDGSDGKTYITIGRDKVGEFAKSLREKSDSILEKEEKENNKNDKENEESLDEMMGDKKEEASLVAVNTAERKTSDRGTDDR